MRRIAMFLVFVVVCGCVQRQPPFYGKCTIEKVDGRVVSVKLVLPQKTTNNPVEFTCSNRDDLNKLIEGLEGIVVDLKAARDQMPVDEKKTP